MSVENITYLFEKIEKCNMCYSNVSTHKLLGKRLNSSQGFFPKNKKGITVSIFKCNQCNLIYSNPKPIPVNLQNHYGIPPEEYWTEEYFKIDEKFYSLEIKTLMKLINFQKGMKSLDIGASIGKAMIALDKIGFEAYGLEPSIQFRERAISKLNIDPSMLKLGMIENVEYDDSSFDFISYNAVIEHVYDPSYAINKALKWLKPSGVMYVEVPSSEWLSNKIINTFYKINFNDYVGNLSPMHEPYHLHEFNLKSFQKNALLNDYVIVHSEYFVCPTYLPKIFDFILKPIMKKTNTGMQLCVWLKKK
jgi:2-polyprenyl-3-methyl-5-hydroxy-6-metoxy-1,4-benzoquinol methylase